MAGDGIRPREVIEAVSRSVQDAGTLPQDVAYLEHEPDVSGNDSNVKLPLLSVQPVSNVRITDFNTDQVGFVYGTDEDGNEVMTGRVFNAEYRLDLQLDVWTASGSRYNESELGAQLEDALYRHDSHGPEEPFLDDDGNPIESIWRFRFADGEPANDLTKTPALRRWRQDVTVWAYNQFDTTESYATGVNIPSELSGTEDSDQISG